MREKWYPLCRFDRRDGLDTRNHPKVRWFGLFCLRLHLCLYFRYEYIATKTGAIIVPSCGMDSVPSDLSVFVGNKTLKAQGTCPQPAYFAI
jgi:hypothetical protein